jgi:hypothetical protein
MSEINIKKLASKLQSVAGKKQLESKDLAALRDVKDGITQVLQVLKECESCGAAVLEIARLELDGVRAAVCHACGIKALRNKSLVLKNVRKKAAARQKAAKAPAHQKATPPKPRFRRPEKPGRPRPAPREVPKKKTRLDVPTFKRGETRAADQTSLFGGAAPASVAPADLGPVFDQIAKACNIKTSVVRKIHQIAGAVAFPMNLERTVNYTRMEAQSQGVAIDLATLKNVMVGLSKKAGLKIRG